jgi:hypothetical protein
MRIRKISKINWNHLRVEKPLVEVLSRIIRAIIAPIARYIHSGSDIISSFQKEFRGRDFVHIGMNPIP